MITLDQALLAAHAADDAATLVHLYTTAGNQAADIDAACFYLTHAYVYALETDDPTLAVIHARLLAHGRV